MGSSVILFTAHAITEDELMDAILQAGGVLRPTADLRDYGGLIDDKAYVWISRVPCYDGVTDNEDELADLERIRTMIGGEFQTWLHIRLGRKSGSQRLAVRFAHTCCQRWSCAVESEEPELFSCKDIERLFREDGAFTTYGL